MREFRNDRLKRAQATILALLVFAQPFFALLPAAGAAPLQTRQELLNEIARRQAALSVEPEPVRRLMHGMLMAEHEYRALLARYEQELADIRKEATEDEPLVKEAQDLAKRYADLTQAAQAAGLLVPHNVAVAIRNDEYTTPSKIKVLGVPLEAMTFDAAKVGQVKTFVERQNVILDRWEEVAELYTKKYGQAAIDEFNRRLEKQRERIEELRKIHEHNKAALEKLFYGRTYEASLGEAYKADDSGRETAVKPPPLPGMRVDLELVVPKYVGDIVLRPQPAAGLNFVRDGSMYLDMAIDIENKHLDADLWLYILESNHVLLKVYDIGRGLLSAVGDPFVKNFSDDSQGFFEKIFNSIWDLGKLLTVDTVTGLVDSCRRIFATPAAFLIIPEDFNPQTDVAEEYGLTTEEAMQLIERRNAWKRAQEDLFKNLTEHTVSSVVIAQRPQGDKFAPDLEGRLKYLQALMLYRDDITARLKRLGDFNKAVDGSLEYMVDVAMPFLVYAGTKSQVAGLSKEAAAIQKAGFKNYLTENIASYKEVWKNRLESVANAGEYLNKKLKAENLVKEADAKITDGSRGNGTPQDAIVEKARQQQVEASKQLLDAHKQMADDFKAKNPDAALPQPPSAPAAPVAPAQAVKVVGQDMAVNLLDDAGKVAGKKLGSGKFGDVYELDNPVNGKAAVKTFSEKCGGIEKGNQVAMQEFSLYQKVSGELDSIITPTEALKLPSGEIVLAKELIP